MLISCKIKHGYVFSSLYKLQSKLLTMFRLTQPLEKSNPRLDRTACWYSILYKSNFNGSHDARIQSTLAFLSFFLSCKVKTDICLLPSSLSSANRSPAGWLDRWYVSHHAHASLIIYQALSYVHSCSWQGCYLHAKLNLESEILAEAQIPVSGFLHASVKSCQQRQIAPNVLIRSHTSERTHLITKSKVKGY